MNILEGCKGADKLLYIVTIYTAEVSEAETLKEVASLPQSVLNGVASLATEA